MAKIFRKTHNPNVLCAVTHSLTLRIERSGLGVKRDALFKEGH